MNPMERSRAMEEPRPGLGWGPMLWLALLLALIFGGTTLAQQTNQTGRNQVPNRSMPTTLPDLVPNFSGGPSDPIIQQKRMRQLNAEQHKAMVSDADRLLKLVTELDAEIDKTSPAALTPDQLRMVAEIEKLAHSVKDKMRNSVQGGPAFLDSTQGYPSSSSHR